MARQVAEDLQFAQGPAWKWDADAHFFDYPCSSKSNIRDQQETDLESLS